MPLAASDQNNYYAQRHRRQSSQSQSNLPDQIRASPSQIQSPNRSLVYLPSTAYSQPQPITRRSRTPFSSSAARPGYNGSRDEEIPNDPRDFYRQYPDPFANTSPGALHQEALRTTAVEHENAETSGTRELNSASTQSSEERATQSARSSVRTRGLSLNTQNLSNGARDPRHAISSTPVPNTARSRKASFKDLVARFEISPEEVPPLPTNLISHPSSRTASPMPYASVQPTNFYASSLPQPSRPGSRLSDSSKRSGGAMSSAGVRVPGDHDAGRTRRGSSSAAVEKSRATPRAAEGNGRLLFGEVVPSVSSSPAAGYGIHNAQRRRGSEGSPMHSPSPMFTPARMTTPHQGETPTGSNKDSQRSRPSHTGHRHASTNTGKHRRAQSDFTAPLSRNFVRDGQTPSPTAAGLAQNRSADLSARSGAHSRIPVITKHHRMASDSAAVSPVTQSAITSQLPLRVLATGQTRSIPSPSGDRRPPSPRRRNPAPGQIKSPGRRNLGQMTVSGEKSPSLRANIIAPPPKISPPLRSSRPRLPVSSATTAASRAKMADRFQTMAKQQSDSKAYRRQRPPELTDIDLKARRLKITQALTRSKEGQDLKGGKLDTRGSSTSRTNSLTPSAEEPDHDDQATQSLQDYVEIPAVVVDEAPTDSSEERAFYNTDQEQARDQRAFTQNALKILDSSTSRAGEEMDSPTLGHAEVPFASIPFSLNTHLQSTAEEQEPHSAVTEGTVGTEATEGTMIDAEPQADANRLRTPVQSVLSQINALRSQNSNSPSSTPSQISGDNSDRADEMSVHLMLRDTTYLDDEEAVEKGYRPLLPSTDPADSNGRNSWTSSIEEQPRESTEGNISANTPSALPRKEAHALDVNSDSFSEASQSSIEDDHDTGNYASDTYTIVNIVLQQRTPSGVVDQQLVDDIYHRIIQISPDLADAEHVDEGKVQRLCLQELEDYNSQWEQLESSRPPSAGYFHLNTALHPELEIPVAEVKNQGDSADVSTSHHVDPSAPPQSFRSHKYKSSLDSAEDWADTSPSVTDWIQFSAKSPVEAQNRQQSSLARETFANGEAEPVRQLEQNEGEEPEYGTATLTTTWDIPRPPSHSPPPPPAAALPSIDQTSWSAPAGIKQAVTTPPPPARPLTALSQISIRSSLDQQVLPSSSSTARPSSEEPSPEQRRLKQRRHVLKELVDTEYTYERDMRVLCDIYKQTAVAAMTDEDTKIIFGNVDAVQQFSKDFLGLLKQVVKPVYAMERSDRRKDLNRASTVRSSTASIDGVDDMTDAEKDELTKVGHAFEASVVEMEKVYTEYIRTRHAANKRLEVLQVSPAVKEWLKECRENSTDITNAWSLDALLVKPIQRITKYPLLLHQLLGSTPDTHPDISFLQAANNEITEVNMRINEVKKHTELVDQVLNRKRKESDVRNGLTKAFGRRAEKLRQHVGINDMFQDDEYNKLKIKYDNNMAHLFLVSKDCQGYIEAIRQWVHRMCELAAAAEAWVDVGHTHHSQAESKLRQFAIVVRGINSIALPDHVDQVMKRVLVPMEKTTSLLERFKTDPKGLIQKRDKRLIDYNQFKNKKERGEKIDKKMSERMEQWEALNLEAKERMKRLLGSTADLVQTCLGSLVEMYLRWLNMCKQKFAAAMEIPLDTLDQADIVKDWQEDFDFHEASALTLSICNGSLLAEASNLLSFLTPGSTLLGEESPRPSWNSAMKRSISMNDDASIAPLLESSLRQSSGPFTSYSDDPSDRSPFAFANGRIRTASGASGWVPRTPDAGHRGAAASVYTTNSANPSRPSTSPGQVEDPSHSAPRLSFEAPSPSIGPLLADSPAAARHLSTSTFYSASPGPSQSQPHLPTSGGSIFSSAMPMGDANEDEGAGGGGGETEASEPHREPGVLFTAASVYEFNIDRSRQQGGFRYLTYVTGEIFDVIAEHGELWLAINQDDESREIGWIWNKHFAKLAE